jgi:hypothetical protein
MGAHAHAHAHMHTRCQYAESAGRCASTRTGRVAVGARSADTCEAHTRQVVRALIDLGMGIAPVFLTGGTA